jgi:hypothetical protein
MVIMFVIFCMMLIPPLLVVLTIGHMLRRVRPAIRTTLLVIASLLLLTPSLGPATIAIVPAPFAYLFVPTCIDGSWAALTKWVTDYPLWHAISFPTTAIVSYVFVCKTRTNNSFKADASGAA